MPDGSRGASSPPVPEINSLVRVTVGARADPDGPVVAEDAPSRVEDIVPADPKVKGSRAQLLIARPVYQGDVERPVDRAACRVLWPSPSGLWELPVAYLGVTAVGEAGVQAWRVEVTGPARKVQRRSYVRVHWQASVEVHVTELPPAEPADAAAADAGDGPGAASGGPGDAAPPGLPAHFTADAVDLSEGGLSLHVLEPDLPVGTRVLVTLALEHRTLEVPASVVRVGSRAGRQDRRYTVSLAFDDPDSVGDDIRPLVFELQVRQRHMMS